MSAIVRNERFQDLVANERVFPLFERLVVESYVECAPGDEAAMRALVERALRMLREASGGARADFESTCRALVEDVFRKGDPEFWFNRVYKHYKREIKPRRRFEHLSGLLLDNRVLDVGCGDGLLSVLLAAHGYRPLLADVLDWRDEQARHLPFALMPSPTKLPFSGGAADTAMTFAVLHHIDAPNLSLLLNELKRTSRRVIIEEDTYDLPDLPAFREVIARDAQLQAFMALSVDDQLRYTMLLDYFSNAISQGIPEMNFPFEFRSYQGWIDVFEAYGFRVVDTRLLGFQKGNFNRTCHVWYVLEGS
jgi:SAM-dependent methyltransferase